MLAPNLTKRNGSSRRKYEISCQYLLYWSPAKQTSDRYILCILLWAVRSREIASHHDLVGDNTFAGWPYLSILDNSIRPKQN